MLHLLSVQFYDVLHIAFRLRSVFIVVACIMYLFLACLMCSTECHLLAVAQLVAVDICRPTHRPSSSCDLAAVTTPLCDKQTCP